MSRTHQNRLRLISKIERHDFLVDFSCDRYCLINRSCIAMTNSSSRLKCSKCVRLRRVCVNMSWSSLNRNRKEYAFKIVENENLLAIVITRLLRNKKILKEMNVKIKLKTQCLMSKMKKFESLKSFDCLVAKCFCWFVFCNVILYDYVEWFLEHWWSCCNVFWQFFKCLNDFQMFSIVKHFFHWSNVFDLSFLIFSRLEFLFFLCFVMKSVLYKCIWVDFVKICS